MLRVTVLAIAIATALASDLNPRLRVTFDESKDGGDVVEGTLYDLAFEGDSTDKAYEPAPINEGLVMNGNYFLMTPEDLTDDNCVTNVANCDEGFAVSAFIKPKSPWEGKGLQYIASFGDGANGVNYGVKIGIRRRELIFIVGNLDTVQRVECKIPNDYDKNAWMQVGIKAAPNSLSIDKPDNFIVPFWNGDKMKDCDFKGKKDQSEAPDAIVIEKHVIAGARKDVETGDYIGKFIGSIDHLEFFNRDLEINELRSIYKDGKPFIDEERKANEAS